MTATWPTIATRPFTDAFASGMGGFAPVSSDNGTAATGLIV